ncbi:hypothetical protein FHS15_004403 [Paenibacillus castaneae]|nr:hypothetical protein [Paenibacillus castaneae]
MEVIRRGELDNLPVKNFALLMIRFTISSIQRLVIEFEGHGDELFFINFEINVEALYKRTITSKEK